MNTPVSRAIGDGSYLLQRFVRNPRQIASVWPSSRHLCAHMFQGLPLAVGDLIIEYGPGTGAFTREVQRLHDSGIAVRYLGIERDPGMYAFLQERFPALDFEPGDAAHADRICAARGLPPAAAIISGLPLSLMEGAVVADILAATTRCLRPDGLFRTFSYLHSYPSRRAESLRALMRQHFEHFDMSRPVLRNLPPAVTLTGLSPRCTGARPI